MEVARSLFTAGWKGQERQITLTLLFFFSREGLKHRETSHQVDVEDRAVVPVDVRVHGALLRRQTDGAVLEGERGVGRDVVSATEEEHVHGEAGAEPDSSLTRAVWDSQLYKRRLENGNITPQTGDFCWEAATIETGTNWEQGRKYQRSEEGRRFRKCISGNERCLT